MRYGYFDEANKEYVIDRPDTPAPWANYLGSPEYGAIISNNAMRLTSNLCCHCHADKCICPAGQSC